MKVTLIDYTGAGSNDKQYAVDLLIFTKSTRLTMAPGLLEEIAAWPWRKKLAELKYMANTIPSSWEFVNYTFMVEGVTRAFTHQFVRTRTASFAQQTMRVLDVSTGPGWSYGTGPSIDADHGQGTYDKAMADIDDVYKRLIALGVKIEDARGILPTNILTNIVAGMNMRTFVEMVRKRSSPRTQGEYRDVLEAMKEAVRAVHPWIDLFVDRTFDQAAKDLDKELAALTSFGVPPAKCTELQKLVDQMRAQS